MDSLQLAELLCARVCHDLSGPVGAAAAGAELFEDMADAADAETLGLVAASAAGAASRLKFFRAALGPAASAPQAGTALRDLIAGYLATLVSGASPGLVLDWPAPPAALDGADARLLLNLVLLAKDALPRGGTLHIAIEGGVPGLIAAGQPVALSEEASAVLLAGQEPTGPRGAQALFTRIVAEQRGFQLGVAARSDGLSLTFDRTPSSG